MLTLVLWQHVVFLCVSRTLFRMNLAMDVRRVHIHSQAYSEQRTTHTQKHDMLPQHQVNLTM